MQTDIQIAQAATPIAITRVAETLKIPADHLTCYGTTMAKLSLDLLGTSDKPTSKLVLVTAINPTPMGEGKSTTTIGLADALARLGKNPVIALREPSMGPLFGRKGGATGGGYAQVIPMADINLHFTGDFHAITSANNLLAAMVDNHIHQGNALGINRTVWRRALDMNDRALRANFDITVASEVMAVLCLSENLDDLKTRLSRMIVAYDNNDKPITAGQLKCIGAMATILKDAINPNLVQTLEGTPAILHGGPFANIAHGCNSIIATRMAMKLGDVAITEAGFGSDLGAQKFIDIKCRTAGIQPDCVVLVATIRALKHNRVGASTTRPLDSHDCTNLIAHIQNITKVWNLPCVVALNHFTDDTDADIAQVKSECEKLGATFALSKVWANGGEGGLDLGRAVLDVLSKPTKSKFTYTYPDETNLNQKITHLATKIYRCKGVRYTQDAIMQIAKAENDGYGNLNVCIAKNPNTLSGSDNPNAPLEVKGIRISAGAGFIVALTGSVLTMPGLPKTPAAENIDIDSGGNIVGLF